MPLLRPNLPFPVCPRCKAVLSYDVALCDQCGYQQPANRIQTAGIQQKSVLSGYQGDFQSGTGMQPERMPVTETQVEWQPITKVQEEFRSAYQPTTGIQRGYPFNHLPVRDTSESRIQIRHMQQMQQRQSGYPVNAFTKNSQQSMNMPVPSVPSISSQPTPAYKVKEEDRPQLYTKRALIYFASVILVTIVLIFVVFHEAGQSVLSLLSHPASTHTVTKSYPLPKGTPLLRDSFIGDSSGWNLQSSPGNYSVSVANGKLSLEDDKNSLLWELLPGKQTYDNFILSVNATLSKGDLNNGYGVYIRGTSNSQSDLATYYRFELYGDSSYAIFKGMTSQSGISTEVRMTNYIINSAIQKQGKLNHIMVIAKGPSLSFIVNGQLLTTITDHSYTGGSMALFVSNLPGAKPGAQAQFSQLAIYPN